MTLDEAIQHCHEKAEHLREGVRISQSMTAAEQADCIECAEEHEQLAEWLTELRDRREGIAVCENCEYVTRAEKQWPCVFCKHNFTDKYLPKKTTPAESDWYDIPAEEMTKEQAQKAVKELRKALLEARTEAEHG
jgi:hypothetical protein